MNHCILAIESSCDDTSAAIMREGKILSNITASQQVHKKYGGIVPEVASRAHNEYIWSVVQLALAEAEVAREDLTAIACTQGPGLMGSLLVGYSFAKGLALGLQVPLIGVHHMKAHILAHFIDEPKPDFPFLCLTVSGGHTQLVEVSAPLDMKVIGQTRDDAAGEAFDKAGKMLGLDYPAGPEIDKRAKEGEIRFSFPKPEVPDLDFSFSGLKTAILYFLRDAKEMNPNFIADNLNDLCASIQDRIVTILREKLIMAAKTTGIKEIAIAGGVSANSGLRAALEDTAQTYGWQTYIPKLSYCTDNAAMIAMNAHFLLEAGQETALSSKPDPRLAW